MVDSLLEGFFEALLVDFAIGAERIARGVFNSSCDNAYFFINVWNHDGFVKAFSDLV